MRASHVLPDPALPGNLHDVLSPQRSRIEALIERLIEAGADATATVLIELLDRADAPSEDREPSLGAPEANLAVVNARYGNMCQTASWRTPTDDLELPDDAEPSLGWRNPDESDRPVGGAL